MRQNRDERYHFLEAVPAALDACSQGLPDMFLDFKKCFTLPAPENLTFQTSRFARNLENREIIFPAFAASNGTVASSARQLLARKSPSSRVAVAGNLLCQGAEISCLA